MDKYAVIGKPIAHSKSPQIHQLFAAQTGHPLEYTRIEADTNNFGRIVSDFFASGGQGLNITVPFKLEAWQFVDDCSAAASSARAVNTIKQLENGDLYGTNTDGTGLCIDLQENLGWPINGARILILGAGGAARGVLQPLLACQPQVIYVHNRTKTRATQLVDEFRDCGPVKAVGSAGLQTTEFDLIINATSASLEGDLPAIPASALAPGCRVYDMMYGDQESVFMQWARNAGCEHIADGLGMLVEQAAEAYLVWRGQRPQTAAVIEALRA